MYAKIICPHALFLQAQSQMVCYFSGVYSVATYLDIRIQGMVVLKPLQTFPCFFSHEMGNICPPVSAGIDYLPCFITFNFCDSLNIKFLFSLYFFL